MARYLVLLLLVASTACLAQAKPGFWDVEKVSASPHPNVNLRKQGVSDPVRSVSTASMKKLLAIKQRIEAEAGFTATFAVTDMAMPNPNAFATRNEKGSFVFVNFAMLDMLGEDEDAIAAVVGHEYAHIALNHRDARQQREATRQGFSAILGFALGMAGVPMAGTISNMGTSMVARTFSRDEERDADEKGMRYAAAAGFAPEGGIRAWEQMSRRSSGGSFPFLSTHPAPQERIENMRTLAATLPRPAPVASAPATATPAGHVAMQVAHRYDFRNIEFEQRHADIYVGKVAEGARTTLQPGDQIVSCSLSAGKKLLDRLPDVESCTVLDQPGVLSFSVMRQGALVDAELAGGP